MGSKHGLVRSVALVAALSIAGMPGASGAPDDARSRRYADGELIVRYRDDAARPARAAALRGVGAERARRLGGPRLELVRVPRGASVESAAAELARDPAVLYAEPNYIYQAAATPNDPYFVDQWGLHNTGRFGGRADADIDAPEAWNTTTGSASVVVAIVDTGIDLDHPELVDSIWSNPADPVNGADDDGNGYVDDFQGWDFASGNPGDNIPDDIEGHGTHVAGIVAAQGNDAQGVTGVAWNATLMPLRVLAPGGGTAADIIAGFQYAADHDVPIVNASLGGPDFSQAMADVIANNPQTLFVVAAGNGGADAVGDDNDALPTYPCNYTAANLICVAATDQADKLTSFSNFGSTSVDIAAPGQDIQSTYPQLNAAKTGSFALTDSPDLNYQPGTGNDADGSWARPTANFDLSNLTSCRLTYQLRMATELGADALILEGSVNGGSTWTLIPEGSVTGSTEDAYVAFDVPMTAYQGSANVAFRFRMFADETIEYDGAYIDDLALRCGGTNVFTDGFESDITATWTMGGTGTLRWARAQRTGRYAYLPGTSMASPMVAGAAALIRSLDATATPARMRALLLNSVDVTSGLSSKVGSKGRLNAAAALLCVPDVTPPANPAITGLNKDFQRDDDFTVGWSATDSACGVANHDVQVRSSKFNNGSFGGASTWKNATTAPDGVFGGKAGFTYCFSTRARDKAANVSEFGAESCTAVPANDRQMSASSAWDRKRGSGYFKRSYSEAKRRGATLKLNNVVGRRIALVATLCSGCGKVKVFRNKTLLDKVSLASSRTKKRRIIEIADLGSAQGPMTIKVKVITAGKPVRIEGLGVSMV